MPQLDPDMQSYYAARASEYERIYAKPERQADLRRLESMIPVMFARRNVLEIACGTGYWTQHLVRTAASILATDLTEETLDVARDKNLPSDRVRFVAADAFDLPSTLGQFDAAFAGFWWSHVKLSELDAFLASLRARLAPGSVVAFLDNLYVEGNSTPIARRDADGNTWQNRRLEDGSEHLVLKNYPAEPELIARVDGFGANCRYVGLDYYWLFSFEIR